VVKDGINNLKQGAIEKPSDIAKPTITVYPDTPYQECGEINVKMRGRFFNC
jgi:hypothetical protein